MDLPRFAGRLVRITLLVPLLVGARVDCGIADARGSLPSLASHEGEADCHHAGGANPVREQTPDTPRHHDGGPEGGHCPVYHSCALDSAFLARVSLAPDRFASAALPPSRTAALPHFDQLPEVPPPRA